MTSSRAEANQRRREREARYDAEEALEARTYHTYNRYGEPRYMIGWSREEIDAWERKERAARPRTYHAREDDMDLSRAEWKELPLLIDARADSQWNITGAFTQTYPRKRRSVIEWLLRKPKKIIDGTWKAALVVGANVVTENRGQLKRDEVSLMGVTHLSPGVHEVRLKVWGSSDIRQRDFRLSATEIKR